jgi:hypothetical protein
MGNQSNSFTRHHASDGQLIKGNSRWSQFRDVDFDRKMSASWSLILYAFSVYRTKEKISFPAAKGTRISPTSSASSKTE